MVPRHLEVILRVVQVVVKALARLITVQHLVRLGNQAKCLCGVCVLALVRVKLQRQPPIGTADLLRRGVATNLQNVVAVLVRPAKHKVRVVNRSRRCRQGKEQDHQPRVHSGVGDCPCTLETCAVAKHRTVWRSTNLCNPTTTDHHTTTSPAAKKKVDGCRREKSRIIWVKYLSYNTM